MVKKKKVEKTESQIFLEKLTVIVAERLKKEKWCFEDAQMKKLTKKDKEVIQKKRAEELKVAVEHERLRLLEEERCRQEVERQAAIEKERRDAVEHELRVEQLQLSCRYIRRLNQQALKKERKDNQQLEWEQYLKCDGLPDPQNCGQMNTYLHLWDKVKDTTLPDLAIQKTNEVLQLLSTLDDFLECPAVSEAKKENWNIIKNKFREYQRFNLDCLAYRLLRDIDVNLDRISIPICRKLVLHPQGEFSLVIWALVQLPIPLPNPKRAERPPFTLHFPEAGLLAAAMPAGLQLWARCVLALHTRYDHYSHRSASYAAPPCPRAPLLRAAADERQAKLRLVEAERARQRADREARVREAAERAQGSAKPEDRDALKKAEAATKEYIKVDASEVYLVQEEAQHASWHQQLRPHVPPDTLNLRCSRVLGGVFSLRAWEQPPQPSSAVLQHVTLSALPRPQGPRAAPFAYRCRRPPAPAAPEPRTPEDIEADLKFMEREYEHLVLVTLQLPDTVLWLDQPSVCQWDDELLSWSSASIYDVKHNEEQQTVQFRTGSFGVFGLASRRYACMPYQGWELRPGAEQRVVLTITCPLLVLEFTVQAARVALTQLQNVPTKALSHLLGRWCSVRKLQRWLRAAGVDVFPAVDSCQYVEGSSEKHWAMEQHAYYQMAQCALALNFAWSRWNAAAGRRLLVMQMREAAAHERVKQQEHSYQMLAVSPLRAHLVDCSEVSATFSNEPVKKMKFYADILHLVLGVSPVSMKCRLDNTPQDVVNTVAELLIATRVLSMS